MLKVTQWSGLVKEFLPKWELFPIVLGIIEIESGGNPTAKSEKGAVGLMQLMPKWHGPEDTIIKPRENIRIGIAYLIENLARFKGSLTHALGAYYYGPSRISLDKPLPEQAQSYVNKVVGASKKYQTMVTQAEVFLKDNKPWIIAGGLAVVAFVLIIMDGD